MLSDKSLIKPIFIAKIDGLNLRFFKSPKADPDFPWHVLDDLFAICGLSRELRLLQLRTAQKWFGEDIRTIATAEGPTTIGPHLAARGLLDAAIQARVDIVSVDLAYREAATAAMKILIGDLPPAATIEYMMSAARTAGIGGDP